MVTYAGKPFFELKLDSVPFLVFPNMLKANDDEPDFLIIKDNGEKDLDGFDISDKWAECPFKMRSVREESRNSP